ncbi:MAG: toll/interleukin-1 receptor domain-containing protein [Defluviitaleaceae bacterium]|nr:toll/interleukin-1 receptor domain-containing protein [Defluviitaleaceae bacterium]
MIFVSYSKTDKHYAENLVAELEEVNFLCWYADRDNPAYLGGREKTLKMIENSRFFLLISSRNAFNSLDVQDEIFRAKEAGSICIEFAVEEMNELYLDASLKLQSSVSLLRDSIADWPHAINMLINILESHDFYDAPPPLATKKDPVKRKLGAVKALSEIMGLRFTFAILILLAIIGLGSIVGATRNFWGFFRAVTEPVVFDEPEPDNPVIFTETAFEMPQYPGFEELDFYDDTWHLLTHGQADAGDIAAQRRLGFAYMQSRGVAQDASRAAYWMSRAAAQGDSISQSALGWMHFTGFGVVQGYWQAAYWYRQAAEQDHARAQFYLGRMYNLGRGTDENPAQAYYWIRRSFENDNNSAQALAFLGYMYLIGRGTAQDDERASYFLRAAAENGSVSGQVNLGFIYMMGRGVPQNSERAAYLFRNAAELGYSTGQFNLATMYIRGDGVERNYETAVYWLRKSAAQGLVEAMFYLGNMYDTGDGVAQSAEQALYWYGQAALAGHTRAAVYISLLLEAHTP